MTSRRRKRIRKKLRWSMSTRSKMIERRNRSTRSKRTERRNRSTRRNRNTRRRQMRNII